MSVSPRLSDKQQIRRDFEIFLALQKIENARQLCEKLHDAHNR